jgi:glycosyltransferase involved in cell wall biosynthesis
MDDVLTRATESGATRILEKRPLSCPVHYVYIASEGFPPTVFDSQVLEHLRLMEGRGICFDLLVFERLLAVRKHWQRNLNRFREVRSHIKGRLFFRILVTTFLGWDLWVPRLQLSWILRRYGRSSQKIIHARTQTSAVIALPLRRRIPHVHVIFDMRGDSPAEYLLTVAKAGRRTDSLCVRRKFWRLKRIERQAVQESDEIICVSHVMKQKIVRDYGVLPQKIHVIPTVASAEKFYWDPQLRQRAREELGVGGQFVLIYAGSLLGYQLFDSLLNMVKVLLESGSNVCLLAVTPQADKARRSFDSRLPAGRLFVRSARHPEMVRWLNAADTGCLIRESHAVNRVAAPTKFSEYLMCGLPVIVTEGIGDYSNFVVKKKVGIVLKQPDSAEEIVAKWAELEALACGMSRARISRIASEHFSNQKFVEIFERLYSPF